MKLLILGGTVFLGKHLVDAALERGHEVTLFHRGMHPSAHGDNVRVIHGDREENLDILNAHSFDAVIDTCGYVPRVVQASAEALLKNVPHYTFISSISVYRDFTELGITEEAPVLKLPADAVDSEDRTRFYGELKAACEDVVRATYRDGALIVRPGLIVGPNDPTDRFTYWAHRISEGNQILVPDALEAAVQVIDVRDLSEWIIRMVEGRQSGTYHATGPDELLTFQEFLSIGRDAFGSDATFVPVSESFLTEQNVSEWIDLPLWISSKTNWPGMQQVDCTRAVEAGLTYRSLEQTLLDTAEWVSRIPDKTWKAGLRQEREQTLLSLWNEQAGLIHKS